MKKSFASFLALALFPALAFGQTGEGGGFIDQLGQVVRQVIVAASQRQRPCPMPPSAAPVLATQPSTFVSAPNSPSPSRSDISRARRTMARSVCESEEPSAREACYACAERGGNYEWLRYGSEDLRVAAERAAHDMGVSPASYRCQPRQAGMTHRAITALGVRVGQMERRIADLTVPSSSEAALARMDDATLLPALTFFGEAMARFTMLLDEERAARAHAVCLTDRRTTGGDRIDCRATAENLSDARRRLTATALRFPADPAAATILAERFRAVHTSCADGPTNDCAEARRQLGVSIRLLPIGTAAPRSPGVVAQQSVPPSNSPSN